MNTSLQIRPILSNDATSLFNLIGELGSKPNLEQLERSIELIIGNNDHFAYVAIEKEIIVGFIHGFIALRLTTAPFLEIAGLVVANDHRRKGIGKKLVRHLEAQFATDKTIRVRCNIKRKPAHIFYRQLAYSVIKEQMVFEKK